MHQRKRLVAGGLCFAVVLLLPFGCFGLVPPYDRVEKGMTMEQVEAILGTPHMQSWSPVRSAGHQQPADPNVPVTVEVSSQEWKNTNGVLRIDFKDGKVVSKSRTDETGTQ